MKNTLTLLLCICIHGIIHAQTTNAVRYQITPNILERLIEKYPNKKEKIESRIKTESPYYSDMYLDSNRVIEVVSFANDSVAVIKIFQLDKSTLLAVYSDSETEEGSILEYADTTINYIDSTDSRLSCTYIEQNNSFPLTACFIKDSLKLNRPLDINSASYPEHQAISKSNQFPIKIVHGNPKAFMTYDFLKVIRYPTELRLAIDDIIKKPRSKSRRKRLFDLL